MGDKSPKRAGASSVSSPVDSPRIHEANKDTAARRLRRKSQYPRPRKSQSRMSQRAEASAHRRQNEPARFAVSSRTATAPNGVGSMSTGGSKSPSSTNSSLPSLEASAALTPGWRLPKA